MMPGLQKELCIVDYPDGHLEFNQHFDNFQPLITVQVVRFAREVRNHAES